MKSIIQSLNISQIKEKASRQGAKNAREPGEELIAFKRLFDEACVADNSARDETDGFHPSALGIAAGLCPRRQVYILRGVTREANHDARVTRIFGNGHGVHERIQAIIDKIPGCQFEAEIVIKSDDPPVSGHADGLLVLWNGKRIIIEIKSINRNGFEMRQKWRKEKQEHFEQANMYAYILDCDYIWFIYECKDDQSIEMFEAVADPAKALKQLKKWRRAYEMFNADQLPERPYKPDSKQCQYCDLKELCWQDDQQSYPFKEEK